MRLTALRALNSTLSVHIGSFSDAVPPVDAGLLVQSGSSAMTGSALYHEITTDSTKNINGGRWAVAKDVKADDTAATPTAFVGTVTVGGDTTAPDGDDVKYGVGEMYITSDGEIYIYTGS